MVGKPLWRRAVQRLFSAVEKGLCAMTSFSGVPWPDLPAQGWVIGPDGRPAPVAAPMDGGQLSGPAPERPYAGTLTPAERRAWSGLEARLLS